MTTLASKQFRFCNLTLLFTLCVTGCQPSRPPSEGRLGLPAEGNVRIIAGKTIQTSGTQTAHWSILGERNWKEVKIEDMKAEAATIALSQTSPLNSATQTPNANVWEIDLRADSSNKEATLSIRSINGTQKEIKFPLNALSDIAVQTQTDQETALPASVPLVKIGDKTVTVTLTR
jgi:hypothetical protein